MSTLAPTLQAFFTDRLIAQQQVSPHTIASYRDAFRLLLVFIKDTRQIAPSKLQLTDLDAVTIGAFLEHLERDRGNTPRTRNIRLAAIHSFFHYAALRHPEHAALIQRVLAIPPKRGKKRAITFLTADEVHALLSAPDRSTWTGRRDHALLLCAAQTGLRISELLALTHADTHLGPGPHIRTIGKGRKQRVMPLTKETVQVLRVWTRETDGPPDSPLFPSRHGGSMTRDAVERRLAKHVQTAQAGCASLKTKQVTMHVLRHTTAMARLDAGVDTATIALWLGHEQERTTHIYLHTDLARKQRTLDRITPADSQPGRYRPLTRSSLFSTSSEPDEPQDLTADLPDDLARVAVQIDKDTVTQRLLEDCRHAMNVPSQRPDPRRPDVLSYCNNRHRLSRLDHPRRPISLKRGDRPQPVHHHRSIV